MAIPQTFKIQLGGIIYKFRLYYNAVSTCWEVDISDVNEVPLVNGVPLITGAYLLSQYAYLGFTGDIYVQSAPNPDEVPDFNSLGQTGRLYFVGAVPVTIS